MKRTLRYILGCLTLSIAISQSLLGYAQQTSSTVSKVSVTVVPSINVEGPNHAVDLGTYGIGDISAAIEFQVQTNSPQIRVSVAATPLFKGDNPKTSVVEPISLDQSGGIEIYAAAKRAPGIANHMAKFIGEVEAIDGFPALGTETIILESSPNQPAGQPVIVNVVWVQSGTNKPQGRYGGRIKLVAFVMPPN